jgi:hypothetical protein
MIQQILVEVGILPQSDKDRLLPPLSLNQGLVALPCKKIRLPPHHGKLIFLENLLEGETVGPSVHLFQTITWSILRSVPVRYLPGYQGPGA